MPGIAEVLRGVVQAVRAHPKGEKVVITADGGIRTGFDVLKMIALGADLVLLARPLARELVPHGAAGVKRLLEFIAGDIRKAMMMTSCRLVDEIDERILSRYPASQGILPRNEPENRVPDRPCERVRFISSSAHPAHV